MKFAIITHVFHKKQNNNYFAYEPYVREMNLWGKYVDELIILAPKIEDEISSIETPYKHPKIKFVEIPSFDITNFSNGLKSLFVIPIILWKIFKVMQQADHIHLRCPGNIGLLGSFVQILFPKKPKTVKYAGNWDPKSNQPFSYNLQKRIVSNTFLTKKCKVLVYGEWKNQTKNNFPFFTASYNKNEIEEIPVKKLDKEINFIYVGAFSKGKQPLLSVKVIQVLKNNGFSVKLNMYGNGVEFENVKNYISKNNLEDSISLHGNQSKEIVKEAFKKAHFLIFISKSEGWPKVVAEAMFWSCLPISTSVSCVPFMLDNGNRGILVNENLEEITTKIVPLLKDEKLYLEKVNRAKIWSQEYTLDKFSSEIKRIID